MGSQSMPPLNQSLWMLFFASLTAFFGWGVVYLSARIERQREARRGGMTQDSASCADSG
jgi:hypothetical protein